AKSRWPKRVAGLRLLATSAKLEFASGSVSLRLAGRLSFTAEDATHVDTMFSAAVNVTVPIQVKFEDGNLSPRIANISGDVTIDQSHIGKVMTGIGIEADLCEKGTSGCSYTARSSWVGDHLDGKLTITDTIE
ncbi:hypothetical protein MAR_005361, partial [Mya arenaria]